jgi:mevalonate kinase
MTLAYAPGKVILLGEHAVVYGRPAIAVPVAQVQAQAHIERGSTGQGVVLVAPNVDYRVAVRDADEDDPLAQIVRLAINALIQRTRASAIQDRDPDLTITVTSTIPIARGMGSGAAVSTAIVRALAAHYDHWMPSQAVSDLVYQAEVIYHGTPSGIDNTVIAFGKPVYFVKDEVQQIFWLGSPLLLAIADTGIQSSTREVVSDLRLRAEADPGHYHRLFDQIGEITALARDAMEDGQMEKLGQLMDKNHTLLQEIGVSCPELDRLVLAAREGGALGAKLSGAGWGGNMIALIPRQKQGHIDMMLRLAGANTVIITEVQ